jgi:hypothetical protein
MPPYDAAKTIELTQLFPDRRQVSLEGLYLDQNLAGLAALVGRPIVTAGYITDKNGIVATTNEAGRLQVPLEIRNDSDWALFQEIMAQSDLVISGAAYLRGIAATGKPSQDVLFQFRHGSEFEHLGEWRLKVGFERREPDLAFVSHGLDFHIPPGLLDSGRRVFVFTSDAMAASAQAGHLTETGAFVVGSGAEGVEGSRMIDYLKKGWGYNVITLATGPGVLDILLKDGRLDVLYITEAQVNLPVSDPSRVRSLLPAGKKMSDLADFQVRHCYEQAGAINAKGTPIMQIFIRYDKKGLLAEE